MAGSVNKVILVGNLGKDPEVRTLQSGGKVVNFNIATSENWTDKASGEKREKTEWHRIVIFNDRLADVAERYLKKGRKVYVEGSLQTRKWTDQSGVEKFTTEIVIDRFRGEIQMLGGRGDGDGDESSQYGSQDEDAGQSGRGSQGGTRSQASARPQATARPKAQPAHASQEDLDDEIPF